MFWKPPGRFCCCCFVFDGQLEPSRHQAVSPARTRVVRSNSTVKVLEDTSECSVEAEMKASEVGCVCAG